MDIFLTAHLKSADDFFADFTPGDAKAVDPKGRGLLLMSLQNKDLPSRYAVSNFLLDQSAPANTSGNGGATALHILFGQVSHDVIEDARLARRLIDAGADINARDDNGRVPFLEVLNMKYSDDELKPIYDLWFEQPYADFTSVSRHGVSPITFAKKLPFRGAIVARMEKYVSERS
ncbi:hypothetical protein [Microbacterium testaceum]|uniref:hypothetical protein n=1 Tax=Microbacterium testaceum TaxID=2033 RepID=UPI003824DA02